MIDKILILVGLFCILNLKSAGQCPTEQLIVEKINYFNTAKVPVEERIKELESYLDRIKTCPYSNDSTHANLLRTLGALYSYEGDFFNAAKYLRQSLELIDTNSGRPSINRKLLSGYLYLSNFYDSLHNVSLRMEAIDNCLVAARKLNAFSDISAVMALLFKTEHLFDIGDYHSCLTYADLCEKFAWRAVDAYKAQPGYYDKVRRIALSSFGWHVEALLKLKEYKQAEQLIKDKFDIIQKANLNEYFGMIYDQLAQVEIDKGDHKEALRLLELAVKKNEQAGDYFNCKQASNNIAYNIYFKTLGDEKNALKYYQKALHYKNKNSVLQHEDSMESVSIFDRIANLYISKNNFDLSDKYFQLAFDHFKKGSNEDFILQIPSARVKDVKKVDYVEVLLLDRADAYKRQYLATRNPQFLVKGIMAYKIADRFLDTIKIALTDLKSKLFWRSSAKRLYENAIEACYLQNNLNDAFYFFEKSRAVLLQDQLNEQRWLGESDIMKQTQLSKKIQQLERQLAALDKSSVHYSELENELFNDRQDLERVREVVKANNPLYYQNFVGNDSIKLKDVKQKILKDHQALIELFAGDSAVYVMVITAQKSSVQKIDKTSFDNLFAAYTRYLSHLDLLNASFDSYIQVSQQLYRLIFPNVDLPAGRVIISPDGKYFPFEALIINKQPVTYFVENFAVSYTYSVRYLLNNFKTTSAFNSGQFMGIAPVEYSNGLAALAGSDQSLQRMQTYFRNPTTFVGAKATKDNFLREYYRYKIVQLYTHATDSSSSGDPAIYFADSTLLLSDLFYENKPASSLIVLSACGTAEGKLYNGEGVFSFNRQFAALGIPSCVSTLWQADNQSTYRITELFYKYLAKGLPLDVALQSAKKEFRQSSNLEHKLPYYWAAPILVGQSGTIELPSRFPWRWAIALGVLVLIGIGGWQARKRRSQKNNKVGNLSLHP